MDFGLGLVLSFTDNASSGMQGAINTLNQMTETASNASSSLNSMAQLGAFSVVADQMGSSFINAGQGILGVFTNLLGRVQQTGSEFEGFRMTLNALYGDSKEAEKQIGKLLDFSIKSPFEVNDVKDMLVVLKSQGIDAFEKMSNASKNFKQENLSWIADLMAFKPDIPTERWKLAITNFLGSGEAKVLRNALDMGDIADLLGHSIGKTAEERMQDLIQIVDDANITGLADNMSNTWKGVASNIDDAFTKLYKAIADNGVFDNLKNSFMGVAGAIMSLDNDELEALGKTIADGLNIVVEPVAKVANAVNGLITKMVELCQTNPEIVKWGVVVGILSGVLLVFGGVALKLMSSLGMLTLGLSTFGTTFGSITTLLKSGSLKLLSTLLPLTATIGLIYLSWKNDFGGIRTLLTNFVSNIQGAFNQARNASQMSVNGMMGVMNQLESKGDFWSNFTAGLIKVKTVFDALVDAWGDYTLSEEMFQKCKELGILPLIEAVLDFKWRWEHFVAGFKAGVDSVVTSLVNFGKGLTDNLKGTIFDTLIEKATQFFQLLTNNDPEAWTRLGNIIGQVTAYALTAFIAFKALSKVIGIVSSVIGVIVRVGSTVASVVGKIIGFIGKIISAVKTVITFMVNNPITMVITGIITAVASFVDMFVNGFSVVKEIIMVVGIALATVGAILMGVAALPAVIVGAIVAAVATLVIIIKEHWTEICDFFSNLIDTIGQFFSDLWEGIKSVFSSIGGWFKTHIIDPVVNAFNTAKDVIVSAFVFVKDKLQPIFDAIGNLLSALKYLFETIWQAITIIVGNALQWVSDTITNVWNAIVGFLTPILEGIKNFFVNIWNGISNFIASAMNTIRGAISTAWNAISSFLSPILEGIRNTITNVWNSVSSFISGVMNKIATTISTIWNNIVSGVSQFVTNIYDKVKQGFDNAVNFIKGLASQAVQWGADFIQGIINGISSKINAVADAVRGVADKIRSFLHFSVPDEGPLTDYESWMPDFMKGLADSITANQDVVTQTITNFTEQVKTSLTEEAMQSFTTFGTQWTHQMQVIVTSTQQMQTGVVTSFQNIIRVITTMNTTTGNVVTAFTKLIQGFTQISSGSTNAGKSYSVVMKSMLSSTQTTTTGLTTLYTKLVTSFTTSLTTMARAEQTQFSAMAKTASTTFSSMASSISSAMQRAVSAVHSAVGTMKSAMNFQWSLPHLKVPHINVSGKFNVDPPSAPKFDVNWYAKGGVFDEPSVIGVGEQGKEAVMPLENNTGWIKDLAYMLSAQIVAMRNNFEPVSNTVNNEGSTTSSDSYMTSNVTNDNSNTETHNDNSVVFNEGAIQIICNNASEEEAIRMAKIIMEYIKRQKEVDKMLAYG